MVEFIDPKVPWQNLPGDTKETCNCEVGTVMWTSGGGCGKKAAYEIVLSKTLTARNCLDHHREHLLAQEKTGQVHWIEKHLPGGAIQLIRHDPYADPPGPHERAER
jgi:hypothetical protein